MLLLCKVSGYAETGDMFAILGPRYAEYNTNNFMIIHIDHGRTNLFP